MEAASTQNTRRRCPRCGQYDWFGWRANPGKGSNRPPVPIGDRQTGRRVAGKFDAFAGVLID